MLRSPGFDELPRVATHLTGVTLTVPLDPWLDTRVLADYSNLSRRTHHNHLHSVQEPIPHAHVGAKILVRRSAFDAPMERGRCRRSEELWWKVEEDVRELLAEPVKPRRRKAEKDTPTKAGQEGGTSPAAGSAGRCPGAGSSDRLPLWRRWQGDYCRLNPGRHSVK